MKYLDQYRAAVLAAYAQVDLSTVATLRIWLAETRESGGTVFTCGNGGSAATASHFATDLGKGASYGQTTRFKVHALTDSMSTITAYSNDVSYDVVFAEQLRNLLTANDLVIAISGSGNSPNVVAALEYANSVGAKTIAMTGRDGGQLGQLAQLQINVPEPHMGRIEDVHMSICHMLTFSFIDD